MNVTCPSDEQLVGLLEDALDEAALRPLALHTEDCARCQGVLAALRVLDAAISEPEAAPDDFLERLLALPDRAPARSGARRMLVVAVAAAAVLLLALLLRTELAGHDGARPSQADTAAAPEAQAIAPEAAPPTALPADLSLPALHRLARGADAAQARLALTRLGELGRRASLPVLIDSLQRADRREQAVEALGALGDGRAVRALAPWLQDSGVAVAAREALVRMGGDEAVRVLGLAIERCTDPEELVLLTDALARANGTAGVRRLGRLLADEAPARVSAARAAIHRHGARLLPPALEELASVSASDVVSALRVVDELAPPTAVPALSGLLDRRSHRARAAEVLMHIDTAAAAAALWNARPFSEARLAYRRAGPGIQRWLLERLERGGRRDQRRAIDLLGLCGCAQALPALAALTDDAALAPHALLAMGRIGGEAAVGALAGIAGRPELRRRAVEALGITGCPAAVAELERLAMGDRSLRVDAQRALATIPCAQAVEAIVRLDGDRRSHRSTERALRGMDRALVLSALDTLLARDPPVEGSLTAAARRMRHAVGGSVPVDAPRVALN